MDRKHLARWQTMWCCSFQCRSFQERTSRDHRQWPGKPYHAVLRRFHDGGWASHRWRRQESADDEPREHHLWRKASHRTIVVGQDGAERQEAVSVHADPEERQAARAGHGQRAGEDVRTWGDLGHGADQDEGDGRGVPRQDRHPRRRHCSGLLQRRPTPSHERRRHHRWSQRHEDHQWTVSELLRRTWWHFVWKRPKATTRYTTTFIVQHPTSLFTQNGSRHCVWTWQERRREEHPGVRLGRWNLWCFSAHNRQWCLRGRGNEWRHSSWFVISFHDL